LEKRAGTAPVCTRDAALALGWADPVADRLGLRSAIERYPFKHRAAYASAHMGERRQALVCVVEIPKGGRNKYEYDPQLGGIKFDRLLMSAATYPTDYGYLRGTLGQDGDPLDALVCLHEPTFPGCLIPVKPLGMFKMRDEKGVDDKIICVPLHDPYWNEHEVLEDLPLLLRQEIEQFFSIYKDLEGKTVTIEGWLSLEEATREIAAAQERLRQAGA
jgi:inorganic pyrophosphatase